MDKQLMTINDLANYYNVDRRTIYRWIDIYDIPFENTPSGNKRFDLEKVKEKVGGSDG